MPRKKCVCICISPILLFHSENNCRLSRSLFVQGHIEDNALKGVFADMEIAYGVTSLCK